jgi:hypothetical protein
LRRAARGAFWQVKEIKGLGVGVQVSITMTVAVAFGFLAGIAPGQGRAEPLDRLGIFLSGVIDRLDATGVLNVSDYDCATILTDLHACTDPVTGLYFLHLPDPAGVNVSLSVVKGPAIDGKDLTLADRESGNQMLAAFKALQQTALAGRDRCALPKGATTDGQVFGVKPPRGSYPVYSIYGGLDDSAVAVLDRAGGDGELLSAVLMVAMTVETCKSLK